jgi:arylsulfatase A-like enzyme
VVTRKHSEIERSAQHHRGRIALAGASLTALVAFSLLAPPLRTDSATAQIHYGQINGSQVHDRRPNVIVIIADDLGYGDTGVYGSKIVRTPNIDALAASGVRFTAGYVTHPVCAPSRAGLMTGRYQERFGYEFNPKGRDRQEGVSLNEIMLPQVIKAAGYATGMIGKWHLGVPGPYYPTERGFDFCFGMAGGGSVYIIDPKPGDALVGTGSDEETNDVNGARPAADAVNLVQAQQRLEVARARAPITRDGVVVRETDYLTDALTREGVRYIHEHREQPFFLYMAYNAPHKPLQVTQKYYDRYPNIASKPLRIHSAMISALDDGVGALEAELKTDGLDQDTIIIFLSDNGCPDTLHGACSNAPLTGFKRTHFEGGIRVPFIVSWPGHVPAGRVDDRAVSSLDIFPTAVAAARAKLPTDRAYDGVDLMPFLTGGRPDTPNPTLYWRAGPTFAIRDGGWKMVMMDKAPPGATAGKAVGVTKKGEGDLSILPPHLAELDQHIMLYDLSASPTETLNLVIQEPATVSRLKAKLTDWNKLLGAPQWTSRRQSYEEYDGVLLHLYD